MWCNILINFSTYFASDICGTFTLSTLYAILATPRRHDDDRKSAEEDFRFLELYNIGHGHCAKIALCERWESQSRQKNRINITKQWEKHRFFGPEMWLISRSNPINNQLMILKLLSNLFVPIVLMIWNMIWNETHHVAEIYTIELQQWKIGL